MKTHARARLTPRGRELLCHRVIESRWTVRAAASAAGVSERTAYKYLRRYREQRLAGLRNRSSAPHHIPHRTPAERVQLVARLRRLRLTGAQIAAALGMANSTVPAWLSRLALGWLSQLDPPEPTNRYQYRHSSALLHIDVKKLGRITRPGARRPPHPQPPRRLGVRARLHR